MWALACSACLAHEIPEGDRALALTDVPAVVQLRLEKSACSGALIAPRVVLTARHCLRPGAEPPSVRFESGPPQRSVRAEVSSTADLALLLLERPAPAHIQPLALPPAGAPSYRGLAAEVVGFGHARVDLDAGKHRAMARIVGDTDGALLVQTAPEQVCRGDSGGPLLVRDGEQVHIAAVASFKMDYESNERCAAVLSAARLSDHGAWVRAFLEAAKDGAAQLGDGCAFEGHCAAGLACGEHPRIKGVRLCTAPCGTQAACAKGFACESSRCVPGPAPNGIGAACADDAACESGVCVASPGVSAQRCRARCWPGAPSGCGSGERCAMDAARPTRHACVTHLGASEDGREGRGFGFWASVIVLSLLAMSLLGALSRRRSR